MGFSIKLIHKMAVVGLCILLNGCSILKTPALGWTLIRVENVGEADFEQVVFIFPKPLPNRHLDPKITRHVVVGPVAKQQKSKYQTVPFAYRASNAYVKVIARGKEYESRPMDYVGAKPLPPGRYTYTLSLKSDVLHLQRTKQQ